MLNKMKMLCCCFAVFSVFVLVPGLALAQPIQVGTELVLLVDTSGSVDATDFALQRDGYVDAFKDSSVIEAIASETGGIAVTLVYWSTAPSQVVGWTQITDEDSSIAFANAVAAAARDSEGATNMADAMNYASGLFASNEYTSTRQIVDVSGDGANQATVPVDENVQNARNNLVASGVDMINALWIDDRDFFGDDPEDQINAVQYGIDNVIYGAGSFSWIVQDFTEFQPAVKDKIYTEIHSVPEPTTMLLLASGMLGLAAFRRRLKK